MEKVARNLVDRFCLCARLGERDQSSDFDYHNSHLLSSGVACPNVNDFVWTFLLHYHLTIL
jgi:hypothetical protein